MTVPGYPEASATRDQVIEWLIREIHADRWVGDMVVPGLAKRKRDREDAELRLKARAEHRAEIAQWLRDMAGRDDLSIVSVLRDIDALDPAGNHVGHLTDAWPLAWMGLVDIECILKTNSNWIPPSQTYRVVLTAKGRAVLAETPPSTNSTESVQRIESGR